MTVTLLYFSSCNLGLRKFLQFFEFEKIHILRDFYTIYKEGMQIERRLYWCFIVEK